ncbi:DUF3303 family protein [Candidatus Pyrohabitans sp.]
MLFLVVSSPETAKPEEVKAARLKFREWIASLEEEKLLCFYPRVGRGSVVIFDVASNDELHRLLTEWSAIVPASFEVYPLATPEKAEEMLR